IPRKSKKTHPIHQQNDQGSNIKQAVSKEIDLWGIKKDGTQFSMNIGLTTNNLNGKPVTVAFLRDNVKRNGDFSLLEKSNAILTEVNRKYSTLIGNLQGIAFRCWNDRDWTMEYISGGCQHITGYSPQEYLQGEVRFGKVILPDDRDRVWNDIQNAIAEKHPFDLAYRIRDN